MKNIANLILLSMLFLLSCNRSNNLPTESPVEEELESVDYQLAHGSNEARLTKADSITNAEKVLSHIESIGFKTDTIPAKLADYAYKDLQSTSFALAKNRYCYNLNPIHHSALKHSTKDLKWVTSIGTIQAYYLKSKKAIEEIGVDCVLEVWDFRSIAEIDLDQVAAVLNFQYGEFYYQWTFWNESMFLIHTRSISHKWIVNDIFSWIESQKAKM